MDTLIAWMDAAAPVWADIVGRAAWQSAIVGLLLLALAAAVRRKRPAVLCYAVLLVALLKFAMPTLFSIEMTPLWDAPPASDGSVALAPVQDAAAGAASAAAAAPTLSSTPTLAGVAPTAPPPAPATPPVARRTLLLRILFAAHLIGAATVLAWTAFSAWRLGAENRQLEPVYNPATLASIDRLRRRMGLARPVRVLIGEGAPPSAFGLFRPTVRLSTRLADEIDTPQAQAILAHELAHHRRRDLWAIAIENALLAVWWFHPVYWAVVYQLRRVREDCCDDVVLASRVADGERYCEGLLQAAATAGAASRLRLTPGHANALHPLGARMRRIMDRRLRRPARISFAGALTAAILAACSLPGWRIVDAQGEPTDSSPAPAAEVVFSGAYKHFSRGGELPEPAQVRVEQGADGTLTVSGELRGAQYEAVSHAGLATDTYSIAQPGAEGAEGYRMQLEMTDGVVHVTRRGVREDLDAKPLTTPAGAVFDPNTRPDPYLVAQIMLRRLELKTGDERTLEVYDWDNSGEALAAYTIAFRHLGKTSITVPAGTFEANHIILEQKTSADTWFKKRAGHLTEFWTLDDGVIVRILRHREPYDLQLLRMDAPASAEPATAPSEPEAEA